MSGAADMRLIIRYFGRALSTRAPSALQLNATAPVSKMPSAATLLQSANNSAKAIREVSDTVSGAISRASSKGARSLSTAATSPLDEERLSALDLHRFGKVYAILTNSA